MMRKRQYYFQKSFRMRNASEYLLESETAEVQRVNINGRLGLSVLQKILDVALPKSILIDYMHVCLLRHTRAIVTQMYYRLKPAERLELDNQLRRQRFPHTFSRKMRPILDTHIKLSIYLSHSQKMFLFSRATEWRNLLFYGLLPSILSYIDPLAGAHLSLYVCAIRVSDRVNIHFNLSFFPASSWSASFWTTNKTSR